MQCTKSCPLYPQKRTGIQVSDVVLWLYGQFQKNKPLPPKCVAIVDYVRAHGWENDLSFAGVERSKVGGHFEHTAYRRAGEICAGRDAAR